MLPGLFDPWLGLRGRCRTDESVAPSVPPDRPAPIAAGSGSGYSPITDQMKPIMMKKPVNIAIRPIPP